MKIYLIDHKLNSSGWKTCFEASLRMAHPQDDEFSLADPAPAGEVIVFLHTETISVQDYWLELLGQSKVSAVVLINTGGKSRLPKNSPEGAHACFWNPTEFGSESRPKKLAEQIRSEDFKAIDWKLLQPDPVEPILAAKLIVEARAYQGQSLHGFQIATIPEDLFKAAQAVAEVEVTDTAGLQSSIDIFETILNRTAPAS